MSRALRLCTILIGLATQLAHAQSTKTPLCLDGFCIGQSVNDPHFDQLEWILPKDGLTKHQCDGVGCKPEIAFRGYAVQDQKLLSEALSWNYGLMNYNLITKENLPVLRRYKYECTLSPRGINGERRFLGAYLSSPSHYLTVVGLRLIAGQLTVYRVARQFPFHNQGELVSLARTLRGQYGDEILFYGYLSSNAYSQVVEEKKKRWFGRSTTFNPGDLSDNAAELVLIDPLTRPLLEPTSMPESGEIGPLAAKIPNQCNAVVPVN
jgi:hypothetical protein